jgi:hypothetical protein
MPVDAIARGPEFFSNQWVKGAGNEKPQGEVL